MESDYFAAVQNPRTNFGDPELAAGTVETNALGLPRPITGAFASVYKLTCPGGKVWAVRCFLRDVPDQQRRYAAISAQLKAVNLPWTVGFEYLARGIRVNGQWYPILKMGWINGLPLNTYVERNLSNRLALQQLVKHWCDVLADLSKAGIAHGDLQHGNILVCNGQIRLIDYDGMYVPALAGMMSNEDGHRNYQHPKRSALDFKANLDNFAAWVIFISLSAFAIEPKLWTMLNCGDENLLFRREDFERPLSSKAIRAMESTRNPQLQSLASHLRSLLLLPLARVPALDGMATQPQPARRTGDALPEWLTDHLPEEKVEPLLRKSPEIESVVPGANWLIDHVVDPKPLPPITQSVPVGMERTVHRALLAIALACLLLAVFAMHSVILSLATMLAEAGVMTVFLSLRYRMLTNVAEKDSHISGIAAERKSLAQLELALRGVQKERQQALEPLVQLDRKYRAIPQQIAQVQRDISRKLSEQMHALEQRRSSLENRLNNEIEGIDDRARRATADLVRQRNEVANAESNERNHAIQLLRQSYISNVLNGTYLDGADVHGIGPKLKARLRSFGVYSAATVNWSVQSVPGIGAAKAATLMAWRQIVEQQAIAHAPASLPDSQERMLRTKYANAKRNLELQIQHQQGAAERAKEAAMQNHLRYQQQLEHEERTLQEQFPKLREKALRDLDFERDRLTKAFEAEKAKAEKLRRSLDARAAELNGSLFGKRVEIGRLERELTRYRNVTFWHFAKRILFFGYAA